MPAQSHKQSGPALIVGDHAPIFSSTDSDGELFDFYVAVTGRPVLLIFCGAAELQEVAEKLRSIACIDRSRVQIVTFVKGDEATARAQKAAADWPFRTVADEDGEITDGYAGLSEVQAPAVYILDPNQRIAGIADIEELGDKLESWLDEGIRRASFSVPPQPVKRAVPVLIVPRVLEPEDCEWLIGLWEEGEKTTGKVALGAASKERHGVVEKMKRREDHVIEDAKARQRILDRVMPRLVPELKKVLHFHRWDMEALRIGCYKAADSGFFNVHRDNCNPSVANRKYAITINLNTGDYEGGNLRFPEYGQELFEPPKGGAIVFSCSMLHEVLPVTKGERYTLLTFLTQP